MKKLTRPTAMLLALLLVLSLAAPGLAAEPASPSAPSWIDPAEYTVFPDGAAYEPGNWADILTLRAYAEAGNILPTASGDAEHYAIYKRLQDLREPSVLFELGLISVKCALNAAARGERGLIGYFESAFYFYEYRGGSDEDILYLCYLWNARSTLWNNDITTGLEGQLRYYAAAIEYLLPYERFTMDQVLGWCEANGLDAARLDYARELLFVTLDGELVHPGTVLGTGQSEYTYAHILDGRTMVPVRRLAELLGAVVGWAPEERKVTITRAADTIVLTIDSPTAYQNGQLFEMDVAPYIVDGRTYIPARYVAEFFGQKVEWNGEQRHVAITEEKSVAGGSNVEAWALAMGSLLNYINNPWEAHLYGGKVRFGTNAVGGESGDRLTTNGPDYGRTLLANGWGITGREGLISTASRLASSPNAAYPAWDLFRVSHLAQRGYLAGYLTYAESLALVEPAAQKVCALFSSWEEAHENYLEGYLYWMGFGSFGIDPWQTERGVLYQEMLADPDMAPILDDLLFETGVIPLPDGK